MAERVVSHCNASASVFPGCSFPAQADRYKKLKHSAGGEPRLFPFDTTLTVTDFKFLIKMGTYHPHFQAYMYWLSGDAGFQLSDLFLDNRFGKIRDHLPDYPLDDIARDP